VDDLLGELAAALGEDELSPGETGAVLKLARDVAHRSERKFAPLSTYLAGVHAGRLSALGKPRESALREAVDAMGSRLRESPSAPAKDGSGQT
jgi:uncharacterized protein DUF6457